MGYLPLCKCEWPRFDPDGGGRWEDVERGTFPTTGECKVCGCFDRLYRPVDEGRGFLVRGVDATVLAWEERGGGLGVV